MAEEEFDPNARARDLAGILFGVACLAFVLALAALYFDFERSRTAGVLGVFGIAVTLIVGFVQKQTFGNHYSSEEEAHETT
ncbi:hypothetical protein [Paucimonas lemoignei]|uniref:hypothetical protein n=1 Tax=Paucimonas lemoignei TaxID=29443 RepID=UPI0014052307|nr:hypothetical protein [Paucimonas lemoignei]